MAFKPLRFAATRQPEGLARSRRGGYEGQDYSA